MPLNKTALFDLHLELGAKMVVFADYQMPLSYPSGIIKEHLHTRNYAGFFDISHMGQIRAKGKQFAAELEKLVPSNLLNLQVSRQRYTLLTNDQGGIIDDLIVSHTGDDNWILVVNAACKQQDYRYFEQRISEGCLIELLEDQALFALQGPLAATVIQKLLTKGCSAIPFMATAQVAIAEIPCRISRCGYTGEDGYEISVANQYAEKLARILLAQEYVAPVGLGARDSLRLEAGLCLYGHDIDVTTTPVEADLGWVVARKYLPPDGKQPEFPGAQKIIAELQSEPTRRRVGILPLGRMPVREGVELFNQKDELVGNVTSGGYSPCIGSPIAMAYVANDNCNEGTELTALVRDRHVPVKVVSMPFIPHRYFQS